jgi:hypothetical protein
VAAAVAAAAAATAATAEAMEAEATSAEAVGRGTALLAAAAMVGPGAEANAGLSATEEGTRGRGVRAAGRDSRRGDASGAAILDVFIHQPQVPRRKSTEPRVFHKFVAGGRINEIVRWAPDLVGLYPLKDFTRGLYYRSQGSGFRV